MTGLRKRFDRWARRRTIRYAHEYQRTMFSMYITKYINKYLKLLTPDAIEYPDLFEYVSNNDELRTLCTIIRQKQNHIVDVLVEGYCSNRSFESTYQNYYCQFEVMRTHIDQLLADKVRQLFTDDPLVHEAANDVCEVAAALRRGFVHSETTAKAKVTEHWVERLPPLILFSVVSLMLKASNIGYAMMTWGFDAWDFVELFTHVYMCMVAIYMVFLRVSQSIYADAKKSSSDVYIERKTRLHLALLRKAGTERQFMTSMFEIRQEK